MRLHHRGASKSLSELAQEHNLTAPHQAITATLNGQQVDLFNLAHDGDEIEFFHFDSPLGKETFWHSSAHILAQAIMRLYPGAKLTIGPAIENGFYYDCANLSLSDSDFEKIEKEIETIVKANYKPEKIQYSSKKEALAAFKDNPFKVELIEQLEESSPITAYKQGEFTDLCRGPHLPSLGKVKALKLLKLSGAYWRGDATKPMLTRIYGISFPDKKELKAYLERIEEAKRRDHRKLGSELDLFSFQDVGPGMPFFHPMGMRLLNRLLDYWRSLQLKAGYVEIKTPIILNQCLWEQSGHWANYRENMYVTEIEKGTFAIKPMNCPGCMLYYGTHHHSYREFPLRAMEFGQVFRHEFSGALSGLFRVRSFVQDDAHIFTREDQIESEIVHILNLANTLYRTFGLNYRLELSTRPEKSIGDDATWELATNGLKKALDSLNLPYKINEGDGAFYGPKIDFHIEDALGRSWQCGTIQLDMALPTRFHLKYTDSDGQEKTPIMFHRALLGSIERFMGIIIEHFAGKFPLWLNPRQLVILPVSQKHEEAAFILQKILQDQGLFVEVDRSSESIAKRVRNAQLLKYNYMLTIGDKELDTNSISVRMRNNVVTEGVDRESFIRSLLEEIETKALEPVYQGVV